MENVNYSHHASVRMQQRGINNNIVQTALSYSIKIYKQGLVFHVIKKNNIPFHVSSKIKDQLKNLIIITGHDKTIITCYKNKNGLKKIKKKTKYKSVNNR